MRWLALFMHLNAMPMQYASVKARDAMNRRLYKGLIIVKTAIYRVFAISGVLSKNLIRTVLDAMHSLGMLMSSPVLKTLRFYVKLY
ncbi:MAG: hypothetical protein V7K27_25900 [Nostoc sp.]|uniref:hypothetical protein n=1 Tax=Nostoc sp. TaxID=1180 RepID=UPI002FFA4661